LWLGTQRLSGATPRAVDEIRAGVVAHVLKQATDPTNGIINPQLLARQSFRLDDTVRELLFGEKLGDALLGFAKAYASGKTRGVLAVAVPGTTATMAGAAGLGGGTASLAGMEALNEWSMLGRLMVNRPLIAQAMAAAALTGKDEALRTFGLTGTAKTAGLLRVLGTQAGAQGWFQVEPDWRRQLEQRMRRLLRAPGLP
jgi:hypothetical protein